MSRLHTSPDLTQGSVTKGLLLFSMPFLASSILQTLYGTVDTIIVGQFVGQAGLTAVNNASNIANAMSNLGLGTSAGATVLIAQYAGAKQPEGIRRTLGTSLVVGIAIAMAISLLVCLFLNPILDLINIPEAARSEAYWYLLIRSIGMFASFGYNAITSALRGIGDSKRPMYFVAVASIINVILDIVFVGILPWGAGGAAVATVLSQLIALIWCVVYIQRKNIPELALRPGDYRVHWPTAKVVLRIGIPSAFQFIFIDLSLIFVNALINGYGLVAASAVAVGNKVVNLGSVGLSALSTGAATMAGQNVGAGKPDRAGRVITVGIRIAVCITAVMLLLIQSFPGPLVRLFTSDAEVLEEGIRCLRIFCLMYIPASFFFIYICIANAVGFTSFAMVCYVLDGVVVRIVASLLLANVFGMGLTGIYWGMGLAPTLSAVLSGAYFYSGKWRSRKLLEEKALAGQ